MVWIVTECAVLTLRITTEAQASSNVSAVPEPPTPGSAVESILMLDEDDVLAKPDFNLSGVVFLFVLQFSYNLQKHILFLIETNYV